MNTAAPRAVSMIGAEDDGKAGRGRILTLLLGVAVAVLLGVMLEVVL